MAEFIPPVILEVKAKVTEAIAGLQKVNGEMDKMEAKGALASGALGKVERASKLAGTALLGLGGAFGVFAAASIKQLDSFEKAQSNLETAITNTGVSFKDAQPIIQQHADAMMNLGFTYNDTYEALATMTAASGSPALALQTLSTAADLARFKTISLAEAGRLLSRAAIGQARGLGDLGIAIGKTIPKGASLATILKAVEDRAGGAAYNFKNTLSGSLQVAQANFQKLEIQVGTQLVPSLIKVTQWITNTGIPKFGQLTQFVKENFGWFKALAGVLAGIWATSKLIAFISTLKTIITVLGAIRDAAAVAGVALAYATGGASAVAATAALAAGAAIYGGFKLNEIMNGPNLPPLHLALLLHLGLLLLLRNLVAQSSMLELLCLTLTQILKASHIQSCHLQLKPELLKHLLPKLSAVQWVLVLLPLQLMSMVRKIQPQRQHRWSRRLRREQDNGNPFIRLSVCI